MKAEQIRDFLKHAFELEGALYKHQCLVDGYMESRKKSAPEEPLKTLPVPPTTSSGAIETNNQSSPKELLFGFLQLQFSYCNMDKSTFVF